MASTIKNNEENNYHGIRAYVRHTYAFFLFEIFKSDIQQLGNIRKVHN